ncbi:hypothetical protein MIND_01166900 [Mycena indigotica]|uniref:Uncharacterized protein n=1 Tax=Mycena indigotica TaxID=2126181 RepID=A0A8H6S5A4_9AGAR|nr:uncharacterized protein MIND_01166900 [Mycena indigotica]KAF7292687.1 hypothetical protein MIND_01166900 [Mycena indigotica]
MNSLHLRSTGSALENNQRSFFDIVWGCFTTIFACVWVSAHPNVSPPVPPPPPKDASLWQHLRWRFFDKSIGLRRRLKVVLAAFIAPELIVGFAGRQLETAWYFSRKYDISLTHGFFISMGGFVDNDRHPLVQSSDIDQHIDAIRHISEEEILDRSQGDAFSKTVALLQALWFVVQCLARLQQHLPLTELEVVTLAFASINAVNWLLWWSKPLDVRAPIRVGPTARAIEPSGREFVALDIEWGPHVKGKRSFVDKFYSLLGMSTQRDYFNDPAVPTFFFASYMDDAEKYSPLIAMLVAALFSAVHCAAWRSHFLSVAEMWLWRVSSLLLGVVPMIVLLVYSDGVTWTFTWIAYGYKTALIIYALGSALYIPARAVLIVLPLIALRDLSDAAYLDVDWNKYLPHV